MSCRSGSTRCAPHEHQHTAALQQQQPQKVYGGTTCALRPRRSLSFCHHRSDNSICASDRAAQLMVVVCVWGLGSLQELSAVGCTAASGSDTVTSAGKPPARAWGLLSPQA